MRLPTALGPVAAVLAVTGAGLFAIGVSAQEPAPPAPPAVPVAGPITAGAAVAGPGTTTKDKPKNALDPLPESAPEAIRIPRIGVDSSFVELGLNPDSTMETPPPPLVGWYTGSPTPGAAGPSTLAGHVTWDRKPVVFFRLGELTAGDRVEVDRADGRTATFEVERTESYAKDRFPTTKVYGDVPYAGLRLITCGGTFDEASNRYLDNVVVYAHLVDVV